MADFKYPTFVSGIGMQNYLVAEEGIKVAGDNKCDYWYIDGSNYEDAPEQWTSKRIEYIREKTIEYKIYPIYHGNFKNPIATDVALLRSSALSYLKKEIYLAHQLKAPLIVHAGGIVEPKKVNLALKCALSGFIENMKEAFKYAEDLNVEIWLENLCNYRKFHPFYYIFTNTDEYETVLDKLENAKMILDVCHETVGGGDPIEVFKKFHERIISFSFSDTKGDRDSHLPLGKGAINYEGLIQEIHNRKWKGIINFETRGQNPIENIKFLNNVESNLIN
ncbi:sugar phosphate isomerase/epimerase family protein [Thiothrix nivea]|uniref:Xylose isomerase domain-containing protein TIM barrel n=1 Tax=Thiothrix nivea (strain ATCC 35100 / DSM 5205 / JP2) TaxID=870187 RepID=A0A656HNM3_THINJ|nr:sugar phosphate isomerase/epimerase [Thiothrix nivea]EIJ36950.1 Xylose isomerase domain-containing protein TIM barrel [Thiothrix nivea DSM 5205]